MAEHKPSTDRQKTIPFVSDAANVPDQEPQGDANIDKAIAAEEALQSRYPNTGTIPLPKDDSGASSADEVKTQND